MGSVKVSMPQFLRLVTAWVGQVKNGVNTPIVLKNASTAPKPYEEVTSGNLNKAGYIDLASRVKSFMDSNGAAPNYGSTTLGKIRYESLVYLFSRVAAFYGTEKYLPNYAMIKPWSSVTSGSTPANNNSGSNSQVKFTLAEIVDAAGRVKSYVETNRALPNYVQMGSVKVSMPQFLRLVTAWVGQVKNGVNTPIVLKNASTAPKPYEEVTSGNLNKAGYIDLASRVKSFMDSNGAAPNYGSTTLGKIRYESLVYLFSRVAAFYGTEKYLPNYAVVKTWKSVTSGSTPANNNSGSNSQVKFTLAEIVDAAGRVKSYVETNRALPSYVQMGSVKVSMPQFLRLVTAWVGQVKNGVNTPIVLKNASTAPKPYEEVTSGNLNKAGYIDLASRVKSFMDSNGAAPNYGSTTLGKIRYESLVYLFSRVAAFYGTEKYLPNYAVVKTWKSVTSGSTPANNNSGSNSQVKFTLAEIVDAAGRVKSYVETNRALPSYVQMGSVKVSMPQFLRLVTAWVGQVKNGVNTPIVLKNASTAPKPYEEVTSGNLNKAGYIDLASRVKSFMDSNGAAPNYGSTTLGKIRYESLVYLFSRVAAFYGTEKYLPNYAMIKPWSSVTSGSTPANNNSGSNSQVKFTLAEIVDAAGRVKSYVETNRALPNYVQMGSVKVSMPQFLRLVSACIVQVKNGVNTPIVLKNASTAPKPYEEVTSGNLNKAGYVDLASHVVSFMDSNGAAPNYGITTLGKIRYESLVYLFSRVAAFYGTEKYLPNYAVVKTWKSVTSGSSPSTPPNDIPSELLAYLKATTNCQVNDPNIVALANSITAGTTSSYEKAQRIFNWVRDEIDYAFYYNTQKGAVKTLSSGSGNCCDLSHLVVALSRAAGLPARYVHGDCYFTTSGNWYGHVFAQIYVNGQWYNADATSYKNELGVIKNWDTKTWTKKGTYISLPF
jgi:enoyl-[acyl-carrier-protein] reductase (NADH)